jgi:hypothetical protein
VNPVPQRSLGIGEIDAVPLTPRDAGRKHDMNQGEQSGRREHGGRDAGAWAESVNKTLLIYTFRNLARRYRFCQIAQKTGVPPPSAAGLLANRGFLRVPGARRLSAHRLRLPASGSTASHATAAKPERQLAARRRQCHQPRRTSTGDRSHPARK